MASFHELKASVYPAPDVSGISSPPNQDGHFGWVVRRHMEAPPEMEVISPTDVTPNRVLKAMRGLPAFSQIPDVAEDEPGRQPDRRIAESPPAEHIIYRSGRRQAASRRRQLHHHKERGGISPQGYGRR